MCVCVTQKVVYLCRIHNVNAHSCFDKLFLHIVDSFKCVGVLLLAKQYNEKAIYYGTENTFNDVELLNNVK